MTVKTYKWLHVFKGQPASSKIRTQITMTKSEMKSRSYYDDRTTRKETFHNIPLVTTSFTTAILTEIDITFRNYHDDRNAREDTFHAYALVAIKIKAYSIHNCYNCGKWEEI